MELNVYIGYDEREKVAADVCKFSIEDHVRYPIDITYLKSSDIPEFQREREPYQATDFTYTRFLVPYLNQYKPGWSVFCDCDFLFLCDIRQIMQYIDPTKAVSVVQHPEYVPRTKTKMDGVSQSPLRRKNWASLIVFKNDHTKNKQLTPELVNTITPGRDLHQFAWLNDDEIGNLPMEWNCLDNYYYLEKPRAIHYTDGGPWFANYQDTPYAMRWIRAHERFQYMKEKI